jgi:hypothetical protein
MDTVFNNRQYAGELWRDEAGRDVRADAGRRARVPGPEAWNVRDDLDSRGALLFRRFAQRLLGAQGGAPFRVPFDVNDPANTPRGLRTEDPRVRQALLEAIRELDGLEIPLDAPLGQVQNEVRGSERLPIHGGRAPRRVQRAQRRGRPTSSRRTGYETVPHGSSYVQVVQFVDGACPVEPRTILTYSQSANRESPFYSDQTRMYGRKQWVDMPFCEDEVRRATLSTLRLRSAARTRPRRCVPPPGRAAPRVGRRRPRRRARIVWGGTGTRRRRRLPRQQRPHRPGHAARRAPPRPLRGPRAAAPRGRRRLRGALPGRRRAAAHRRAALGAGAGGCCASSTSRPAAARSAARSSSVPCSAGAATGRSASRSGWPSAPTWSCGSAGAAGRSGPVRSSRRRAGVTHRLRIASERLPRGTYTFELTVRAPSGTTRTRLTAVRL